MPLVKVLLNLTGAAATAAAAAAVATVAAASVGKTAAAAAASCLAKVGLLGHSTLASEAVPEQAAQWVSGA